MNLHSLPEIELELVEIIRACAGLLTPEEATDMLELTQAGEPGVALENLCEQLAEHSAVVPAGIAQQLERLGRAMGIQSRYWERLARE